MTYYLTLSEASEKVEIDPHVACEGPWGFKPAFTPSEMLQLGVFGLNYFGGDHFQESDLEGLDDATRALAVDRLYGSRGSNSWVGNCFEVKAGMDYERWKEKGLITDEDPLGWFHWYCRFFNGRRIKELDNWQIARWQNFSRWLTNGKNQFVSDGKVSAVVLQSLLQWGYNPLACFDEGHKFSNERPPIPMNG